MRFTHTFSWETSVAEGEEVDSVVTAGGMRRTILFTAPVDIEPGDRMTYNFARGKLISVERDGRIVWQRE